MVENPFSPVPEKLKSTTYKVFKWVFALIFLYIVISIFSLFLSKRYQFIEQIVTLSIGGFFGFFMGYFGWRAGQILEEHFNKISKK